MNLDAAYTRHLDWRSGAMQSQGPIVMCQVCSPTCCSMTGEYWCKSCSLPLCAEAADRCSCDTGVSHDVVTFALACRHGLCKREEWES